MLSVFYLKEMINTEPKLSTFEKLLMRIRPNIKVITLIVVTMSLPLIYWFVYATGGIKFVFSHTMYLPILLSGTILGKKWGVFVAIAGGLLLGPLMPIDTILNEPQLPINYIYRAFMFVLVGFLSGLMADILRKQVKDIHDLFSLNQETSVPNANALLDYADKINPKINLMLVTILLNNAETIIDVVGLQVFHQIIHEIHVSLTNKFDHLAIMVQAGVSKFWFVKPCNDVESDAKLITQVLSQPIILHNVPLYVEFSVGASILHNPRMLKNFEAFSNSDSTARHAQKNNLPYLFYNEDMLKSRSEFELLGMFTESLKAGQMFLMYQPKIDLHTNKPCGLEALIRWNHPEKGMIMPNSFIPLIEESQLIHQLTSWVLNESIQTTSKFKEHGIETSISINVSAKNLFDVSFSKQIIHSIKEAKIKPFQVEVEITETALMANPEESKNHLKRIYDSGVQISLDDFGTGYSSLAYLSTFPLHILKIDRMFISSIEEKPSIFQIVKSTIELAHQLGYLVVAEGVETKEIADKLHSLGCDIAQGFYYAKPMEYEKVLEWYKERI